MKNYNKKKNKKNSVSTIVTSSVYQYCETVKDGDGNDDGKTKKFTGMSNEERHINNKVRTVS